MATGAAVVSVVLPTTGSVSATVSGFGTPTAAIVFASNANTTNPTADHALLSAGFWVSGTQVSAGYACQDAVSSSTIADRRYSSNRFVELTAIGGALQKNYTAAATTDGIEITAQDGSTGLARYALVLLIKGTTNQSIGTIDLGTGTSAQDITAPGFEPNCVVFIGNCVGTSSAVSAAISFGVACKNGVGSISQACAVFASTDNQTDTVANTGVYDGRVSAQIFSNTLDYHVTASDFDASGFSVTSNASANSDTLFYLALQLADSDDAYVGVIDSKTTTGTQAHAVTSFTPQALTLLQMLATSTDSVTQSGSLSVGMTDGTRTASLSVVDEDAASTSDTQSSYSGTRLVNLLLDTFADDAAATLSSFDADGWTLNYSDGSASARKMLAFAIGDSTAGSAAPTITALSAIGITASSAQPRISYS